MNFQTRLLDKLHDIAVPAGYDIVLNFNYVNTGHAFVQQMNTFSTLLHFTFDFQTNYYTFYWFDNDGNKIREDHYLEYHNDGDVNQLIAWFESHF